MHGEFLHVVVPNLSTTYSLFHLIAVRSRPTRIRNAAVRGRSNGGPVRACNIESRMIALSVSSILYAVALGNRLAYRWPSPSHFRSLDEYSGNSGFPTVFRTGRIVLVPRVFLGVHLGCFSVF